MSIDVLVVDDDEDIRLTLTELLEGEGYQVAELADGRVLVQAIEREHPRLVLLDLTMPHFDADVVARQLAAKGLLETTQVLVLSGRDAVSQSARRLGFHGAVRKPFDIDELLGRVAAICRTGGSSEAAHP